MGESWNDILEAYLNTNYGYGCAIFFVSFIFFVTTLFTNLFIGLIIDAYDVLAKDLEDMHIANLTGDTKKAEQSKKVRISYHHHTISTPIHPPHPHTQTHTHSSLTSVPPLRPHSTPSLLSFQAFGNIRKRLLANSDGDDLLDIMGRPLEHSPSAYAVPDR